MIFLRIKKPKLRVYFRMTEEGWKVFREEIERYDQELSFYYMDEEWWISRVPEGKSFLLSAPNSDTQYFETAEALFRHGIIDGKTFIEQVPNLEWN